MGIYTGHIHIYSIQQVYTPPDVDIFLDHHHHHKRNVDAKKKRAVRDGFGSSSCSC